MNTNISNDNLNPQQNSTAAEAAQGSENIDLINVSKVQNTEKTEERENSLSGRLNWLRAGVLGANDGIVSTAGLVVGVAGAAVSSTALFIAGIAGMVAGALSMAAGEYVSVSTQRDAEQAALTKRAEFIASQPEAAQADLARIIMLQGVDPESAKQLAAQLSKGDALKAHAHYLYGIDPDELTNPWHAAWASMGAFAVGALIPLLTILLSPASLAVTLTVISVSVALAITGSVSAWLGGAPILRATIRNIIWGNAAMIVTYGVGYLVGQNVG
ncbi:MAG: VIT family protein [Arcanobacterium sp.]|nr:VIT family protein [Arcanobacterium sp.]